MASTTSKNGQKSEKIETTGVVATEPRAELVAALASADVAAAEAEWQAAELAEKAVQAAALSAALSAAVVVDPLAAALLAFQTTGRQPVLSMKAGRFLRGKLAGDAQPSKDASERIFGETVVGTITPLKYRDAMALDIITTRQGTLKNVAKLGTVSLSLQAQRDDIFSVEVAQSIAGELLASNPL